MREVEERELRSYKCRLCGCRNKKITEYALNSDFNNEKIAYKRVCCNCGEEHFAVNPDKTINKEDLVELDVKCYQWSRCMNKNCPLYNSNNSTENDKNKYPNQPTNNTKFFRFSKYR